MDVRMIGSNDFPWKYCMAEGKFLLKRRVYVVEYAGTDFGGNLLVHGIGKTFVDAVRDFEKCAREAGVFGTKFEIEFNGKVYPWTIF